ncbi:MAG: 5'-nucleotidase C-terminal domain-containing protein, partial [Saprospiraceae bacterium]
AKDMTAKLMAEVDIIVPLTHLNIQDDLLLAKTIPGFPLIIGGHDHDNMRHMVGNTVVAKADANAKTAYIHTLTYNKKTHQYRVDSKLVKIDEKLEEEVRTKSRVDHWNNIATDDLARKGFDPDKVITYLDSPLDGRESTVRGGQCDLGSLVAKAITAACSERVDGTIVNSGSIRVDDMLSGNLTQYDIIRILPYPSKIIEVEMTGTLLKKIMETSVQNRGQGAYLQVDKITIDESTLTFKFGNKMLRTDRNYIIAMTDFLLTGYDYKFLTRETEGIINIVSADANNAQDLRNDLRKAAISFLENHH